MEIIYLDFNKLSKTKLSPNDILVFSGGKKLSTEHEQLLKQRALESENPIFVVETSPFKNGGYVDPVSLNTEYAENDRLAINATTFLGAGGFDFRMKSAAATDLVWRLHALGFDTKLLPSVTLEATEPSARDCSSRFVGAFMLSLKYGDNKQKKDGFLNLLKAIKSPVGYYVNRKNLIKQTIFCIPSALSLLFMRDKKVFRIIGQDKKFYVGDYAFRKGETTVPTATDSPLVSVVVRTYKRKETLRQTLISLANQTYKNFEVIVAEDGEDTCRAMLENDFKHLNIKYINDKTSGGRAANANRAVKQVNGEFVNFLDDDDFLFPDHLETAVNFATSNDSEFVIMGCMAIKINVVSNQPYAFEAVELSSLIMPRIDVITMTRRCLVAIESVFVSKNALLQSGLMREQLDAHEDWNLWLRIMTKHKPLYVKYCSCACTSPADDEQDQKRILEYSKFDNELLKDEKLMFEITADDIREFESGTDNDLNYLLSLGMLRGYLEKELSSVDDIHTIKTNASDARKQVSQHSKATLSGEQLNAIYFDYLAKRFEGLQEG